MRVTPCEVDRLGGQSRFSTVVVLGHDREARTVQYSMGRGGRCPRAEIEWMDEAGKRKRISNKHKDNTSQRHNWGDLRFLARSLIKTKTD